VTLLRNRSKQIQFDVLIIYYWLLLVLSYNWIDLNTAPPSVYYATVIPILVFITINLSSFVKVVTASPSRFTALILYVVAVGLVSLVRLDLPTAYNVAIFSLTIVLILKNKLIVRLGLINLLYLLTLAFCIIGYHAGINPYGYLPSHGINEYYQQSKSLFPYAIVGSAFFSLVVLIKNYFHNHTKSRWPYILVCLYFILYSYNRTSLVCLIMFLVVILADKISNFRNNALYRVAPVVLGTCYLFFVLNSALFSSAIGSSINSDSVEYLTSNRAMGVAEELSGSARPFLMASQIAIFLESPIFGVGTFRLDNAFDLGGNETFLTGLIARVGLMILPFVIFYVLEIKFSLENRLLDTYVMLIILFVIMLTYGVIMVPYDVMFLLMIGMLNNEESQEIKPVPKAVFGAGRLIRIS
jgi:O-Antigen ligase